LKRYVYVYFDVSIGEMSWNTTTYFEMTGVGDVRLRGKHHAALLEA
jgi:hypothetical protein